MKEMSKNIAIVMAVAFIVGALLNIGRKAVDAVWPDKPTEVHHTVTHEN